MLGDESKFYKYNYGQSYHNILSPLETQIQTELAQNIGSPFASDFGNDHNGFHFQDGTGEQDAYLTELLDEVFNNECSGEESVSQKNSVVGSETQLSDHVCLLSDRMQGNSYVEGSRTYGEIDAEMAHMQVIM